MPGADRALENQGLACDRAQNPPLGPEHPGVHRPGRAAHTFQSHTCTHIVEKHGPGQRLSVIHSLCHPTNAHGAPGFKSPPLSGRIEACGGHVCVVIIIGEDAIGTEARHPGTLGDLQCPGQSHSIKDCPPTPSGETSR